MKPTYKLDKGETIFFSRQLEYVKGTTYDVKQRNLKAMELIPVSTETPSGSDTIVYRSFDAVGCAKVVADYAHDFPRVDVIGKEVKVDVKDLGASYGYSVKEIRRAQTSGVNLNPRRAVAARRAIDELIDKLAWGGDVNYNIQGFVNYPGITEYTVISDGTGASKLWTAKTSAQKVRDITGMLSAVMDPTSGREVPDTLLLPLAQYNDIATTLMTTGNDTTILTFILKNNPYLRSIEWVNELKGAGVNGTDRAMVYVRDPEHLTLEIPQAFEQFPPQWKGLEAEVPCHAETAGVIIYYPLSVAYADGI